eukprot:2814535-Pyramimonas_sp.AAC.1
MPPCINSKGCLCHGEFLGSSTQPEHYLRHGGVMRYANMNTTSTWKRIARVQLAKPEGQWEQRQATDI